jgi:O-antigen/teichoic acid export membrane protein
LAAFAGGVVTAATVSLASVALGAAAHLVIAVRLQPAVRRPRVNKATMRQLLNYGSALTVSGLASIVLTTAQRLFLAHNHSTSVVAFYSVAATVGTTLYFLPDQLVAPLLPGLTRLAAQAKTREHKALYGKCLSGLFLLLTPAAIMLAFLARPFLSLWAGPVYGLHSTGPLLVIIVGAWFNSLASVPLSYLLSSGRTRVIAYIQVAELAPYGAGAYVLTAHFAAVGAAVVWSATLAVQSVAIFAAVHHVAPQLPASPLTERRAMSLGAPAALAGALGAASLVSHGLAPRLAWAAGVGFAYLVASWYLVLTARERQGLRGLTSAVVRRG